VLEVLGVPVVALMVAMAELVAVSANPVPADLVVARTDVPLRANPN
jgi:hypothetical protein